MAIEFELKFRATDAAIDAIRKAFSEHKVTEYQMETTYYDTVSGALSARHYTLRRRMENEESVCTLKTPAGNLGRNEIEISCESIEKAIPQICANDAPEDFGALVQEGLIPVCGAKFHRYAILLSFDDCSLELALDQGILSGGSQTIPLCEVELELKSGDPKAVELIALELACKYKLTPETRSKFRRALSLYQGEHL